MREKILPFIIISTVMFFVSCSNEELLENKSEKEHAISLTASMPEDDDPTTRMTLDQLPNKTIDLKWVVGDIIALSFKQGGTIRTTTSSVNSVSANGKVASFNVVIPAGINTGAFDLYGAYGGNGLNTNSTDVKLPLNPGRFNTLQEVENNKDVMLYFAKLNLNSTNAQNTSVTFQHLGSLFSVSFKNNTSKILSGFTDIRLVGQTPSNNQWAYNAGAGGKVFCVWNKVFARGTTGENFITFNTAGKILKPGESMILWAWYPIVPNRTPGWPALQLQTWNGNVMMSSSVNAKPAKAPVAGKSYYFYARADDTTNPNVTILNFTDESFTTIFP